MAKRGNIRGSRWATIIIVIVVIAMAGSTLPFSWAISSPGPGRAETTPDAFKQSIQEVKEQLEQQAKQLEDYIDEYGPTEATWQTWRGYATS